MDGLAAIEKDDEASDGIGALRERCKRMIVADGQTATALPGLWFVRISDQGAFPRNFSPLMHIAVALSGRKSIEIDGQRAVNDTDHYLVVLGNQHYDAWVEASPEQPYAALKLQFPPDLVARVLLDLSDAGHRSSAGVGTPPPLFVGRLDDRLAALLGRLLDMLDDPLDRHTLAPACMTEIANRLLRSDAAAAMLASIRAPHRKMFGATRFIEEHARDPLTVAAIAERFAISPAHFARQFRALTSVTPMQYLKMARLNSARRLLLNEHDRVEHVCQQVGYQSVSHFSRDFRNHFGVSPGRYAETFWRGEARAVGTGQQEQK